MENTIKLYKSGMSEKDIAKKLGLTVQTIKRRLKGIRTNTHVDKATDAMIKRMIELRQRGETTVLISEKVGVSPHTVSKYTKHLNFSIKGRCKELYNEGMNVREISEYLNRTEASVRKHLTGLLKPNTDSLQKGVVKLRRGEKVFETLPAIKKGFVKYELNDSKNTVVYCAPGLSVEELKSKYNLI